MDTREGVPKLAQFDPEATRKELQTYLDYWSSPAKRYPAQTRQILRKLLPRHIRVWRQMCGKEPPYHYEAEAAVGRLFRGIVSEKRFGVPNGIQRSLHFQFHFVGSSVQWFSRSRLGDQHQSLRELIASKP
jgi:hypothetical protein